MSDDYDYEGSWQTRAYWDDLAAEELIAQNTELKSKLAEAREALEEEMKFHHRTHAELVTANCKLLDIEYDKLKS